MIRVHQASVVFKTQAGEVKRGLSQVNLSMDKGEFVTVIGSNGAGKSTLMGLLSGEVRPVSGEIWIGEENLTHRSVHQRAPWIARVFQDPMAGTCGNLTVEENLILAARRGAKRSFRFSLQRTLRNRVQEEVEALGLGIENQIKLPIQYLSGGQRQAVSLLMAIMSPLKVLLLDEHTAALDPKTAELIMTLTRNLVQKNGITTLMVTHSLDYALQFGSRTLVLNEGRIVGDFSGFERRSIQTQDLMRLYKGTALVRGLEDPSHR